MAASAAAAPAAAASGTGRKEITLEELKALKQKLSYIEIPVKYKNRIGVSKVSGTIKGTIFAGVKILGWIFKYSFK